MFSNKGVLTLVLFLSLIFATSALSGPNVCKFETTVAHTETVPVLVAETVETTTWCWKIPPRCKKEKTIYVTRMKVQTTNHIVEKDGCCDGYKVNNETDTCEAERTYIYLTPDGENEGRRGSREWDDKDSDEKKLNGEDIGEVIYNIENIHKAEAGVVVGSGKKIEGNYGVRLGAKTFLWFSGLFG